MRASRRTCSASSSASSRARRRRSPRSGSGSRRSWASPATRPRARRRSAPRCARSPRRSPSAFARARPTPGRSPRRCERTCAGASSRSPRWRARAARAGDDALARGAAAGGRAAPRARARARRQRARRHGVVDRADPPRERGVLPARGPHRRAPAPLLRAPLPGGRGGRELLRAAAAAHGRGVGRAHAAGLRLRCEGFRRAHRPPDRARAARPRLARGAAAPSPALRARAAGRAARARPRLRLRRRAAGHAGERAAGRGGDHAGARGRALPRPAARDLGPPRRCHHRTLRVPLRAGRARRVGGAHPPACGRGAARVRAHEQLPPRVRGAQRQGAGRAAARAGSLTLRAYYCYQAAANCVFFQPIFFLYYERRAGLSVATVLGLQSYNTAVRALLDFPLGAVADRTSRRNCLVVAAAAVALGAAALLAWPGLAAAIAAETLFALASALRSGADSALLYDGLERAGRLAEYARA